MVIVDSTVWIDFMRGVANNHTLWLDEAIPQHRMAMLDVILCEVLQGIRDQAAFDRARLQLLRLPVFATGGADFAVSVARNYCALRGSGYTVRSTVDCWIATFCLENGHSLLHRDRDFDAFENLFGLRVIHP